MGGDREKTVLVIDDEPGLREGLEILLSSSLSVQVQTEPSVERALMLTTGLRERTKVILLDDQLGPGATGFASIAVLKKAFPCATVIMFGAVLELRKSSAYDLAGIAAVFSKPFSNDRLVYAVRDYLCRPCMATTAN